MLGGHVCLAFGVCGGLRWKSTLVRGYLMVILKEAHGLRMCLLLEKVKAERQGYVLEERRELKKEERTREMEKLENGIVAKAALC